MDTTTTATTTANSWRELAELVKHTEIDRHTAPNAHSNLRGTAEIFANILNTIAFANVGMLTALNRIMLHYAATSSDEDKSKTLNQLSGNNGAVEILALLVQSWDIIGTWSDALETIANAPK